MMNRRNNSSSSRLHSPTKCHHGFNNGKPNDGVFNGVDTTDRPKRKGAPLLFSSTTIRPHQITVLLLATMAGVAFFSNVSAFYHSHRALSLSSSSSDEQPSADGFVEDSILIPQGLRYDICFVSSAFASSADQSDRPADMASYFSPSDKIGCLFFTNLPGIEAPGWTKIIQSYPYAYSYKRFKTHSGALKFMSWREPVVQQHCSFVFYIDATFAPKQDAAYYRGIRDEVMNSHGYGLALHPQHQNGIYYEFELILENEKDIMKNVKLTIDNLKLQPDFRNEVPVYDNAFLCYDPTSTIYQNVSNRFWSHYALEQDSWRDQPWWAYTISQFQKTPPFIIPTRADTMTRRGKKGLNGHHYNETSEGTATKHRRTHPPIDSCGRLTMQSKAGALPCDWPNAGGEIKDDDEHISEVDMLLGRTNSNANNDVKPLERHWTKLLSKMASLKQSRRIIDVGTDHAFYSSILASPSLGSIILDIFEPNKHHVLSLCESVLSKRWTSGTERRKKKTPHVYVNPYGLSGVEGASVMYKDTWAINTNSSSATTNVLETTTLDNIAQERGWLDRKKLSGDTVTAHPHIFILKVDAQHMKAKTLLGAKQLIEAHLAQYVFLELSVGGDDDTSGFESALSLLFQAGYKLEGQGWNADGPADRSAWPHDAKLASKIVAAAQGRSHDQLYLLWGLQ